MGDSKKALISNVQKFSLDDGPGIRTTIFFKGCTLKCRWCHNPENIMAGKQVWYRQTRCIGCRTCMNVCGKGVLEFDGKKAVRNPQLCDNCGKCAEVCPTQALETIGGFCEPQEVWNRVKADIPYFERTNGGITVSGGEPLLYAEWVKAFAVGAKNKWNKFHLAVDTAGNVPWTQFETVLEVADLFLYDLKIMDEKLHREMTGCGNQMILDNFRKLCQTGRHIWVRVPLIPAINDTEQEKKARAEFLKDCKNVEKVEFLPYHTYGIGKYEALGWKYLL